MSGDGSLAQQSGLKIISTVPAMKTSGCEIREHELATECHPDPIFSSHLISTSNVIFTAAITSNSTDQPPLPKSVKLPPGLGAVYFSMICFFYSDDAFLLMAIDVSLRNKCRIIQKIMEMYNCGIRFD